MDPQCLGEILEKIGVTHCGTYCFSCGANFPPHLWRRHFNRQHPDVNLPKKINNITSILHHKISTVLLTEDPSIYRANSNIYRNIKCTSCNGIFRDNHQIQKHLKSHHNVCNEQSTTIVVQCYRLKCGRMFPIPQTIEQQDLATPQRESQKIYQYPDNQMLQLETQQIYQHPDNQMQQRPPHNTPQPILTQTNLNNEFSPTNQNCNFPAPKDYMLSPQCTNKQGNHHTPNTTHTRQCRQTCSVTTNQQPIHNSTPLSILHQINLLTEYDKRQPHPQVPYNGTTQSVIQQTASLQDNVVTRHEQSPPQQLVTITPVIPNTIHINQIAHSLSPNPALKYMQYFNSMPYNNTVDHKQVEAIISELIDRSDTPEYWLKILHKFIATEEFFINNMKSKLELHQLKPEVQLNFNSALKKIMDLFIDLEGHVKSIADGIPANWKASLVKFEVSREQNNEIEGATTWSFRYRQNSSPQLREFGYLLCYLRHHQCPILDRYYEYVNSENYCPHTAFKSGMVAKFIYELTVETVPNGDSIPWLCKFALHRCFMMDGNKLKLKRPNVCGKQFATTLYMLRVGVLTCASMMLHGGHSEEALSMIHHVQKCHVINMISPWISHCRAMDARSCQKESSHLASNGDIICNNATFRKCIYKQLIPLVRSSICETFNIIFETDKWQAFLSNQNMIRVSTTILLLINMFFIH